MNSDLHTDILKHELRAGWLEVPEAYHPLDFIGAAMGSYVIYQGATGKGPDWVTIAIGTIMVYIHTQRFFYAPQSQGGVTNLFKALDIKREDICQRL